MLEKECFIQDITQKCEIQKLRQKYPKMDKFINAAKDEIDLCNNKSQIQMDLKENVPPYKEAKTEAYSNTGQKSKGQQLRRRKGGFHIE